MESLKAKVVENNHRRIAKLAFREGYLTATILLYKAAKTQPEGSKARRFLHEIANDLHAGLESIVKEYFNAKT